MVLLFIGAQEWIIILIAIVILLIWGPSKLPALARGIGQALHEFRRASAGVVEERREERKEEKKEEIEQQIIELARSLGISTEGKTKEQILAEIREKVEKR